MVVSVSHDDAPVAVDGNAAKRAFESSVASASADGANMGAVAVAQHLHAVIALINNNIMRRAAETFKIMERDILDMLLCFFDSSRTLITATNQLVCLQ